MSVPSDAVRKSGLFATDGYMFTIILCSEWWPSSCHLLRCVHTHVQFCAGVSFEQYVGQSIQCLRQMRASVSVESGCACTYG